MNRDWKNRKTVRPPIGEEVEVANAVGQGALVVKIAKYTVETWCYLDNNGVECECPLETFEVWREKAPVS